jgi:glucose/arabinose dehydrogenase
MLRLTGRAFACAAVFTLAGSLAAQAADGPATYADDFENPSGIAIQPKTGDVFVSERKGVFRLSGDKHPHKTAEIDHYSTDIYGKGPMYDIGPLGVAFLNENELIVADGSRKDAEELVRVYKVGAKAPAKAIAETAAEYTLGPIPGGADSAKGEGNFYAIAITGGDIFITSNGDDTKGWIVKSTIEGGKPGALKAGIATKPQVEVDAPVGITVDKAGDLVVGQMGEVNKAGDSLLTTYDPKTGKLKTKYETGLNDIAGLAYSPVTGKLYAVDFSWVEPKKGGLFELVVSGDKCEPRKVADLDKPTALAFDSKGNLYVTAFGTAEEGSKTKAGKVLWFAKDSL